MNAAFKSSLHWNFYGCIIYELIHLVHLLALQNNCNEIIYKTLLITTGLIPLAAKCADIGFSAYLPTHWTIINRSKKTFHYFLTTYCIPYMAGAGCITSLYIGYLSMNNTNNSIIAIACGSTVFAELIVCYLRKLLNLAWQTKKVVLGELLALIILTAIFWTIWLNTHSITATLLCIAIHRWVLTYYFIQLFKAYQQTRPTDADTTTKLPTRAIFFTHQAITAVLRISRESFAPPILAYYIAQTMGTAPAAIFYTASMLTSGIKSVVKMIIGYSGSALLANQPTAAVNNFSVLTQVLVQGYVGIFIIGIINISTIIKLCSSMPMAYTIAFLWFVTQLIESVSFLYEQLYISRNASIVIVIFRLLEWLLFYASLSTLRYNLITLISVLTIIRSSILLCTWAYAYQCWQTEWKLKTNFYTITISSCIGIFLLSFFK